MSLSNELQTSIVDFTITVSLGAHLLSDFDPAVDVFGYEDGVQVQCEVCRALAWIAADGVVWSTFSEECSE